MAELRMVTRAERLLQPLLHPCLMSSYQCVSGCGPGKRCPEGYECVAGNCRERCQIDGSCREPNACCNPYCTRA